MTAPEEAGSQTGDAVDEAEAYLAAIDNKMSKLVSEFAAGRINRRQFQQLYEYYQRQINTIIQMMAAEDPGQWKEAIASGESVLIRRRHAAKARGMAIYMNESSMPLETLGDFAVDPALIVPMLSSYRSAASEIFRAGMRSTQLEDGQWLWIVPGEYTTMILLFSSEPAEQRLAALERMHKAFEKLTAAALAGGQAAPSLLAYTFLAIIKKSRGRSHTD